MVAGTVLSGLLSGLSSCSSLYQKKELFNDSWVVSVSNICTGIFFGYCLSFGHTFSANTAILMSKSSMDV